MSQRSAFQGWTTYLSTVQGYAGKAAYIFCTDIREALPSIYAFQEVGDDGLSCSFLKFLVLHRQVNPIQNGIVELLDQVGCQEQHAVVIFQFAKKDSHQAIPLQGKFGTPLQKHVGFVQQKQSIPGMRRLENVGKLPFQNLCIRAQFSGRDLDRQHGSSQIPTGARTE